MIRAATVHDIEPVLGLLTDFAAASLIDYKAWTAKDLGAARYKLLNLILHQYLIVAEKDGVLIGMIGAQREQDPWIESTTRMRELFWWVDPAHRRGRLSAELYIRWEQDCERFIRDKLVDQVSLSTQPGSSDLDLSKRGWRCVESHWIKE
jgi:N-acetylglutamate synthase-like GNAT family acetyltransferase